MFLRNPEAVTSAIFDPIEYPQFDKDNKPIFHDGGNRIDWIKVKLY